MTDVLPGDIHELARWLDNLESVAQAHRGRFGLDDGTLDRLGRARRLLGQLSEDLRRADGGAAEASGAAERAMAALVEAERGRAEARRELLAAEDERGAALAAAARAARPVAELAQRRRRSSASLKAQGGPAQGARQSHGSIAAPATPGSGRISSSSIRLAAPADLQVTAQPSRINHLSWRGTGEPGARYLIEAAVGKLYRGSPLAPESAAYRLIAAVHDETAYQHAVGQVAPGVHVRYRLRVARESLVSDYSAEVTVACR
ncbi:hypothetical protein WMF18_22945 [Sorangium sp. So ce315]|uniref:hypothetical protein n=1 Tax=Sorangium sp. So ce315 TaxID=3133299 RepID=UPI003F60E9A7